MKTSKVLTTTSLVAMVCSFGLAACGGSEVEPVDQSQQAGLAQRSSPPASPAPAGEAMRPEGQGPHGHRMGPPSPERMMERFDTNKDGQLQAAELPERMQQHIGDIDKNGDAVVSKEELTAHFEAMRAEHRAHFEARAKERFQKRDTNHDGMLEQSEVEPEHWARLSVADANGDQKLTLEELKAAFESGKLQPPRGAHHRFDRERGEPPTGEKPVGAPPAPPAPTL